MTRGGAGEYGAGPRSTETNNENRGVSDRADGGPAARTMTEKLLCNPNTALRRVQTRVWLMVESQPTAYDRGEKWWTSAGYGAPSLIAQLPLLDEAEGKSIDAGNIVRALSPNLPGKDARDLLRLHP